MDQGPHLRIIPSIHKRFGMPTSPPEQYRMETHEAQWDFVYPVSAFMDTYRFPVLANDLYEHYPALALDVEQEVMDGARRLTMTMNFVSFWLLALRIINTACTASASIARRKVVLDSRMAQLISRRTSCGRQ